MNTYIPALFVLFSIALIIGIFIYAQSNPLTNHVDGPVACTLEAKLCPDGSAVGRSGPNCEFAPCPEPQNEISPGKIREDITQKSDHIVLQEPPPNAIISSPLRLIGEARGTWYFEATFPIAITDQNGRTIAEGYAEAQSNWMTTEFVPFSATISFAIPENTSHTHGMLILKKANASGLPEHDDALEIPIQFQ